MDNQTEQPLPRGGILPVILTVGGFSLFLVIVIFFWFDKRPDTVAFGGNTPEARSLLLRELREREQEKLTGYGWVDRNEGIVRLPIERAMELTVEEMNQDRAEN